MTIAFAAVTRRDVVANVAAVLREERSIDVVPQAHYRNDCARSVNKPAVRDIRCADTDSREIILRATSSYLVTTSTLER